MMKGFAIVSCLLIVAAIARANDVDKYAEAMQQGMEECAKEAGITLDKMEKASKEKNDDAKTAGCLNACLLKKYHMMKDGKISIDKIKEMIDTVNGNEPEKAEKYKTGSNSCVDKANKSSGDECEVGLAFVNCMLEVVPKVE